ncbi:hypothetical protein ACDW_09930 [Acidovorax sp. DW039]|uniref:hypothetical protein n=1 Tax=Acidovorax sp. DW039 TaxID=3095606 RepID=UPI00308C68FB|nr:hypothetical protein ACDW_09930 [Acidovorax sp. DW039]
MLTEIEWWGGLIFVVGAWVYRSAIGALDQDAPWDANRLLSHVFFLAPAAVLAGYFYPLNAPALRYAYLGALGVALFAMVTTFAMELKDQAQAASNSTPDDGATRMLEPDAPAATGEAADEEVGTFYTVLGMLVLYSPVLVACGLGCVKAWRWWSSGALG